MATAEKKTAKNAGVRQIFKCTGAVKICLGMLKDAADIIFYYLKLSFKNSYVAKRLLRMRDKKNNICV